MELLAGQDGDRSVVRALGGRSAEQDVLAPQHRYWLRVWAARGLLWAWGDDAAPALRAALGDEAWRVREMAARVVARHRLGDLLDDVQRLRSDPVQRVRVAAERAVVRVVAGSA